MGILNFQEIERPTKNKNKGINSKDLGAFEKFAEEFFSKIIGAKLITRMRRGADNALDLKLEHEGKKILVSCKHYAHTDSAIGVAHEENAFEAVVANSCDEFIGFYSTEPSSGLITRLEGYKNNEKFSFDYKIYKNTDIESALLDDDSAKGWLLAARFFPASYSNLFQRFVIPIEHYKIKDVKRNNQAGWELGGPYGGIYSGNWDPEEIVKLANDSLTNSVHASFFVAALKESIDIFPRYFGYREGANRKYLKLSEITPIWDQELGYDYPVECNVPIIVCALWSFWDSSRAQEKYLKFQKGFSSNQNNFEVMFPGFLSVGGVAKFSYGELRNIFSRLVAFCPSCIEKYDGHDVVCFESDLAKPIEWKFANSESVEFLVAKLLNE
jgi:hypothetical protein